MKLVTFTDKAVHLDPHAMRQETGSGGVLHNGRIYKLSAVAQWVQQSGQLTLNTVPTSVLDFVGLNAVERETLAQLSGKLEEAGLPTSMLSSSTSRPPGLIAVSA